MTLHGRCRLTFPIDPFRVNVIVYTLIQSLFLRILANCLDLDDTTASRSAYADFQLGRRGFDGQVWYTERR